MLNLGMFGPSESIPSISLKALLDFGGKTDDGRLVEGVAVP